MGIYIYMCLGVEAYGVCLCLRVGAVAAVVLGRSQDRRNATPSLTLKSSPCSLTIGFLRSCGEGLPVPMCTCVCLLLVCH